MLAATTILYSLNIAATGDPGTDRAISDTSRLVALREDVPVGPFGLIARAEGDIRRIDTVLRGFGHYDALVEVRIAGLALDDPGLMSALEPMDGTRPVEVAVAIDPGPVYRIRVARLEGPLPEPARAAFQLASGQPALAREVLAAGTSVLDALREDGFAFARVSPPDALVDHDTQTMDVIYVAEPGPRVTLGEIDVIGLQRLHESYVLRRLGLVPGEPFSPSRLESARRDLLAGGAVAWARIGYGDSPDGAGRLPLRVEIAERPLRVANLSAAWSSDEGGTAALAWTHRNLLGGAERLDLRAEAGRLGSSDVDSLSYLTSASLRVPDFWLRDLDLRLDLGAVKEDLEAYARDAFTGGGALERRFSPRLAGSAGLAYERSWIVQDGVGQDYRIASLPLTLTHDGTDDPLNPRRGQRLTARVSPAEVLTGEGSGFVLARVSGSLFIDLSNGLSGGPARISGYGAAGATQAGLPGDILTPGDPQSSGMATGRTVLAGRLVLGTILGASADDVPPDWRFYAGGGGSVRGYPYQSIGPQTESGTPTGGDGLLEASIELRHRLGDHWGIAVFADAGSVSSNSVPGSGDLSLGLGAGVRFFTPVGPVRLDLAAPLDPAEGDPPVQIYIGIGQSF